MTSAQIKVTWIDDDKNNEEDARNLESKNRKLHIKFIPAIGFESVLKEKTDLFLIDDRLHLRNYKNGLAVAGHVRVKFPETPIYLFSAWPNTTLRTTLAQAAESAADKVIDTKKIRREGHDILYYDALDYRKMRTARRHSLRVIFRLLRSPLDDQNRIRMVLPESLKKGLSRTGNAIALGKWVSTNFLASPGFLYDSLYASTKLGMTESAFCKRESRFRTARYSGIFSNTSGPLWWNSTLMDIVFRRTARRFPREEKTDLPDLTKRLFNLASSEIAKCVVCGRKNPETIGLDKYDESNRHPVHIRCSIPHPTKTRAMFFEEVRQFVI